MVDYNMNEIERKIANLESELRSLRAIVAQRPYDKMCDFFCTYPLGPTAQITALERANRELREALSHERLDYLSLQKELNEKQEEVKLKDAQIKKLKSLLSLYTLDNDFKGK